MTTVLMGGAPAASLAQTPPPKAVTGTPAFLHKTWPVAAILGAFPFLALPVAAAILLSADAALLWVYVWLFSMTHFVVTFAIYLRSENLRYFASSRMNIAIFFVIPAAIFVLLDLYHALRVGAVLPLVGLFVLGAIRLIDFNHFNRQSFGVLQLFKARSGIKAPVELKRTENLYFCTLTGLIFATYLAGGVFPLVQTGGDFTLLPLSGSLFPSIAPLTITQPLCIGFLVIAAGLYVAVVARLHRHTKSWAALGYIGVQSIAALAAAAFAPLYLAALAVHYIEYHVLMAPRCLRSSIDPSRRLDRVYGRVRSRPILFYGLVIAMAGVVTLLARVGMGMMGHDPASAAEPTSYLALIALFDGLFVFHYFIEMFIWKFGDPHFRNELSGLYFAAR